MVSLADRHRASVLLGFAVLSCAVGQGTSIYYRYAAHRPLPAPSATDGAYLVAYVLLFVGMLLLPRQPLPHALRSRVLVNGLMIIAALATLSWYFTLGPEFLGAHQSASARIVGMAYSVLDLVLIFGLTLLSSHLGETGLRRFFPLLVFGLMIIVATDSVRDYQAVHNLSTDWLPLDAPRVFAFLLVGVAAWLASSTRVDQPALSPPAEPGIQPASGPHVPTVWRYIAPFMLIPAVVVLMIYVTRARGDIELASGVYIGGAVLIELVFVHQFLAYRELIAYTHKSAHLESLAAADPITGLPNHRAVVARLDEELERSLRSDHACTILVLDLDHFKQLNDTYGHRAGDAALREFASVVRVALRSSDVLGRWGGEEFVALLPETDADVALAVSERIRAAVAAHRFRVVAGGHITCSVGVASYPRHAQDRDGLIEQADQAMYVAKRLGRDRVHLVGQPIELPVETPEETSKTGERPRYA